jgi:hypothetical protein
MKKILMLATAAFLVTGVAFAHGDDKKCAKGKECCKKGDKKECSKDAKDAKAAKTVTAKPVAKAAKKA